MKKLVVVVVLLLAGIAALGSYRGWFRFSTDNTDPNVNATITVDQDRIQADREKAEEKVQDLGIDPVMNIRFSRAFAAGKREYQGRTYHFYTKESLQAFEKAPSEYVEPRLVTAAVCLNARNVEADNDPLGEGRR